MIESRWISRRSIINQSSICNHKSSMLLTSCCLIRLQLELLHPPVRELADEDLVLVAAIDFVHRPELFCELAGPSEFAQDAAVQFHLVDFAVIHVAGAVRVRAVHVLMRAGRNA